MDNQILLQKIVLTINTLNQIEVHGKQNLNYMLGCIQTLEDILEDIGQEKQENINGENK
jgi:hypothetical protein